MNFANNEKLNNVAETVPPHAWFGISAIFHYLGPSFAVLLFPHVGILGVIWLRLASASLVLGVIGNPLRTVSKADKSGRLLLLALGISFAAMNTSFYMALDRLPMSMVASIEFVGIIGLALAGVRSVRNFAAFALAISGVFILINVQPEFDLIGLIWTLVNTFFFVTYIMLGHKAAQSGVGQGIDVLSAAMIVSFVLTAPFGFSQVLNILNEPYLLLAGAVVGICSSVIPYVCDQFAMSRLPRATFALMMSLLPAMATIIAAIVLTQIPSLRDIAGILLVVLGVALHRPAMK